MKTTAIATAVASLMFAGAVQAQSNAFSSFFKSTGSEEDPAKVSQAANAYADKQPDWARPFMKQLYRDGEWGAVLNFNRLGLAAMEQQQFATARKAFDQAIVRVEAIYADDANAAKARSVFNAEQVKDFKGEPYERAMMYYYRGLLYLQEGDYQNARAAFLAADRHDTLSSAEDKAFAGDFGMMKYLAGWASRCDGDTVRAAHLIDEAQKADTTVRALPAVPGKTLVLVDVGSAPVKWGDGQYQHILKIKPGSTDAAPPRLGRTDGSERGDLMVIADVDFQATTRGGREIDGVMAGKAQFKDTAGAVGDTAMVVGSALATHASMLGDSGMANIGLAGMFIGLVAKGIEKAANPAADVRAWDTLPAKVLVQMPDDSAAGPYTLTVSGQARVLPLQSTHGACTVAWGRTNSALSTADAQAAGSGQPAEANRGDRNRAFRSMLSTELIASN